jgi:hypothetical protein
MMWKSVNILRLISPDEAIALLRFISNSLKILNIVSICGKEDRMLKIACERNINPYDVSYLYMAVENREPWLLRTRNFIG